MPKTHPDLSVFRNSPPKPASRSTQLNRTAFWPKSSCRSIGPAAVSFTRLLAQRSRLIVEFGTSFGISTIHLAAAVETHGVGRVITTEMEPNKVRRSREHLEQAGLLDQVEIREGDALETLKSLDGPIDLLFLDGWKKLYLPLLRLLEPRLRSGSAIVGDDTQLFPEEMKPYLDYVRNPANGYVSVEIPLGDGMELSIKS